MHPTLLTVLTFLAAALAFVAVYSILTDFYLRDRARLSQRMEEEFRLKQRARAERSPLLKALGQPALEEALSLETAPGLIGRYELMVEQSGLNIAPTRLLLLCAGAGLLCGMVAWGFFGNMALGAATTLMVSVAPLFYVSVRRKKRLEKLLTQLPDALDLIARVIRAGQTISQAMRAVADEFQAPIAGEFAYCYEQQDLGLPPEIALRDMARRTGLLEIKIFIMALLVQRQTGGNLAVILENLAAVVRDRFRIRDKIRVLTAEGRLQAGVLLALPPLMLGVMLFLNPTYTEVIFEHPNFLVVMFISMGIGALWIRKIVNFKY